MNGISNLKRTVREELNSAFVPVFGSLARDTLAIFALGAVGGIIFALLMGPGMSQGNMQLLNIELIEIIDQLLN